MLQLHHLALGAQDVVKVANFYAQAFELPVFETHLYADRSVRSIWLELSQGVLMIERAEGSPHLVRRIGSGLFLIAFQVSEAEKDACQQRVIAAGGQLDGSSEHSIYARDPENNRIAVSSYPLPQ